MKTAFSLLLIIMSAISFSSCSLNVDQTKYIDVDKVRVYEDNYEYNYAVVHTKRILDEYGKVNEIDEIVETQTTIKVEIPYTNIQKKPLPNSKLSLISNNDNTTIKRGSFSIYCDDYTNTSKQIYSFKTCFINVGSSVITLISPMLEFQFTINVHEKEPITIFSRSYVRSQGKEDPENPLVREYSSFVAGDYDEYLNQKNYLKSLIPDLTQDDFNNKCLAVVSIAVIRDMRIPLKEVVLAKSQDKEHWNCEVAFIVESQNVDFDLKEKCTSYFYISALIDKQILNDLGFFDTGVRPVRIIETLKTI